MKKIILALMILLFFSGNLLADTQTKGKLAIWLGYGETLDAFKLAQVEFAKQYPNVEVEILTFALRDFEAKLAIAIPTGVGPDILALHDFLFPRYYESESMEVVPADLSKMVNDPSIIDAPFARIATREGKLYGVPWWTGRSALFYNLDHFKEAGLSGPPKTLDQLWEYAEKLVRKDANGDLSRAGLTMRLTGPSGGIQKFGYMYYQVAGEQVFESGKKPGTVRVTLKKNLDAAARVLMARINHLHGAKKVDDWKLKHDAQGFASGAASMLLRESWVISWAKKNGPDLNFGVAPMPRDKSWGAFNFIELLSVNKDSKLKQASWDFIRILQSQAVLDNVLEVSGWIPLRKDRDFSGFLSKQPKYKAMMDDMKGYNQFLEPPNLAYEEATTRTGEVIQEAYRDASLVNNLEGNKKVIMKAYETALEILKDQEIFAEN